MDRWQAVLFLSGAGCPACEGIAPRAVSADVADDRAADFARAGLFSGDFEGEGGAEFLAVADDGALRPFIPWERPAPIILETCAGCAVAVTVDPDDGATLDWTGGDCCHFPGYGGAARSYGDLHHAEDAGDLKSWADNRADLFRPVARRGRDARTATGDDPTAAGAEGPTRVFCPRCVYECSECDTVIFARSELEAGDTYAPGSSFPNPRAPYSCDALCVACMEEIPTCAYCGEALSDDEETDDDGRGDCCKPQARPCADCGEDIPPADDRTPPKGAVCGPCAVAQAEDLARFYETSPAGEVARIRDNLPCLSDYSRSGPAGQFRHHFGYRGEEWIEGLPVVYGLTPIPDAPGQLVLLTCGADGAA